MAKDLQGEVMPCSRDADRYDVIIPHENDLLVIRGHHGEVAITLAMLATLRIENSKVLC